MTVVIIAIPAYFSQILGQINARYPGVKKVMRLDYLVCSPTNTATS